MTLPSQLASDTSHRWFSVQEAARYFGKDQSIIHRWCHDGTAVEAGMRVFRDPTRHFWIGIPVVHTSISPDESLHSSTHTLT